MQGRPQPQDSEAARFQPAAGGSVLPEGTPPDPVEALAELFREHYDKVFRAAYRITGNAMDAEDVLQSVFLRLARRQEASAAGRRGRRLLLPLGGQRRPGRRALPAARRLGAARGGRVAAFRRDRPRRRRIRTRARAPPEAAAQDPAARDRPPFAARRRGLHPALLRGPRQSGDRPRFSAARRASSPSSSIAPATVCAKRSPASWEKRHEVRRAFRAGRRRRP